MTDISNLIAVNGIELSKKLNWTNCKLWIVAVVVYQLSVSDLFPVLCLADKSNLKAKNQRNTNEKSEKYSLQKQRNTDLLVCANFEGPLLCWWPDASFELTQSLKYSICYPPTFPICINSFERQDATNRKRKKVSLVNWLNKTLKNSSLVWETHSRS